MLLLLLLLLRIGVGRGEKWCGKKRKKPGEKSELKRKQTEVKSDNRNRQEENKNRPNGGENGDKTRRKKGRTREEKGGWGEGSKLIVEWIAAAAVVEIDGVVSRPEAQRRAGPRRGRGTKKKPPPSSSPISSDAVQALLDHGRDRLNLGAELLLDPVEVEPVVVRDQVDGEAQVAEAARAAHAVQVRLRGLGEVEVDDDVDRLDVDPAREQVRGHEVAARAVAEVVEDAVAVALQHARVDVEARVAELGDLLRQELDAVDAVAEDDRLVDLQLGEERVEAVDLSRVVGGGGRFSRKEKRGRT